MSNNENHEYSRLVRRNAELELEMYKKREELRKLNKAVQRRNVRITSLQKQLRQERNLRNVTTNGTPSATLSAKLTN